MSESRRSMVAEMLAAREQQRLLDLEPCPKCGGDKLRTNFMQTPGCHVRPAAQRDPLIPGRCG